MKKLLLLFAALLLPLLASAQTKVEIDGIWYNLYSGTMVAEVTYKGSTHYDYWDEYSGSITIPNTVTYEDVQYNVTSIGAGAFDGCSSLTAINIPESVMSIGDEAFDGCSSLTAINIPESVTSFGWSAFQGCSSLTTINIPESVKSIGWSAFQGCSSLTAINIPESVTSIGFEAFRDCSSLTTIVLPKNLNKVDYNAFASCTNLRDVYCFAEVVPSTESDAFKGSYIEYVTLHVPTSAINSYKGTAPWSSFGTIVALTEEEMGVKNSEITNQKSELIHDLRGRRVDNPTKGDIYIVGGKKMVW